MPPNTPPDGERPIEMSDLLVRTSWEVAEKVEALGLSKPAIEAIAICESPAEAARLAIRSIVQQRGFMDSPDVPHQLLIQVGVLRNESPYAQ